MSSSYMQYEILLIFFSCSNSCSNCYRPLVMRYKTKDKTEIAIAGIQRTQPSCNSFANAHKHITFSNCVGPGPLAEVSYPASIAAVIPPLSEYH